MNVKKILAVINATYAVAKRKPEKIRLAGIPASLIHSAVQIYEFHIFIISVVNTLKTNTCNLYVLASCPNVEPP